MGWSAVRLGKLVSQATLHRTPWEIHRLNPCVVLSYSKTILVRKPCLLRKVKFFLKNKIKENAITPQPLATGPGGGKDWAPVLESSAAARMEGKQTLLCSMPTLHLFLTLSAPPLLSFAVSQDLFSHIFLPDGPLHFSAPDGLG